MFTTTDTLITTHRNRDSYETIKVSEYGLLPAQKTVYDDYKQKIIIHKYKYIKYRPSFLLIYLRADFQLKVGVGYRERKTIKFQRTSNTIFDCHSG